MKSPTAVPVALSQHAPAVNPGPEALKLGLVVL
jgi:hypothetical protein